MQYRRDFFLIFKEAINNILRHSKADEVNMSLSFKNELIHLKICDNGIGIDTDSIKTGNGLHNMKTRSALLKGELKIYNGKDRGCCVELILPIG